MDLDIEMDVDDVQDVPGATIPQAYTHDIITGEEQEPGEVDEPFNDQDNGTASDQTVVPYKVHIKGLDTFNPDDVKGYLAEHYGTSQLSRIEWIDDSSANYIFKSESAAQEALIALAAVAIADPTQLPPLEDISGKGFTQKPDSVLRIRFAVAGDKKVVGAAERSRFYLLHPEYDPGERRRRGEFTRGKYRDRDDRYRRDGRGDRRRDRREGEESESFDVSLYDDDASALAKRARRRSRSRSRRRSASRGSSDADRVSSHTRRNRDKELFPGRLSGAGHSLRDRSASPIRDRDGNDQMDLDEDARAVAALRSRERGRSIKERLSKDNSAKELFPSKNNGVKELFPTKVGPSSGGKAQMDQVSDTAVLASAKLADRITSRLASAGPDGFNIRGIASQRGSDQGIAIKGTGPTVKELFPEKFGNAGKELFAEKIEGRGRRRQRAEDLFY
ncbi:RRM domain-containing protein [Madurella fahalii]|uniref:RRM domain-containing protein n=1 Tax=Madurella fahalii TaxID=1157608 RepID=A0ABQ0G8L4_9PEZI